MLDAIDVLVEPGVWAALKRTLRHRQVEIQSFDPVFLVGVSIKPEPVPVDVKVLMIGTRQIYRLLYALDEDFNTAQAMGILFELVRAVNRMANHKKARRRGGPVVAGALRAFELLTTSLGLLAADADAFFDEVKEKRLGSMGVSRADVDALIVKRGEARAAKDWSTADAIRDELNTLGIDVRDGAEGVTWRVRVG